MSVQIHVALVFALARIQEKIPGELFMYWFRARGYLNVSQTLESKSTSKCERNLRMALHAFFRPLAEYSIQLCDGSSYQVSWENSSSA